MKRVKRLIKPSLAVHLRLSQHFGSHLLLRCRRIRKTKQTRMRGSLKVRPNAPLTTQNCDKCLPMSDMHLFRQLVPKRRLLAPDQQPQGSLCDAQTPLTSLGPSPPPRRPFRQSRFSWLDHVVTLPTYLDPIILSCSHSLSDFPALILAPAMSCPEMLPWWLSCEIQCLLQPQGRELGRWTASAN